MSNEGFANPIADSSSNASGLEAEVARLHAETTTLRALLERERADLASIELDRNARGKVIEEQGAATAVLHGKIHEQLQTLNDLYAERERLRREMDLLVSVLDSIMSATDAHGRMRRGGPGARSAFLDDLRDYNHEIVDHLARATPIAGRRVLDIGASPHGFALEWAMRHRVAEYVGIGLDIAHESRVEAGASVGILRQMNAERLDFPDGSFDAVVTISTFEHIGNLDRALAECHRVLRPGAKCLVAFEPIWTSSGGHHLHHFGACAKCVPDWSHLVWTREQMARHLEGLWPGDAPLSADQAVHWVYDSDELNRVGIRELHRILAASPLKVEWIVPMREEVRQPERFEAAMAATGLTRDELLTRGYSMLLSRS